MYALFISVVRLYVQEIFTGILKIALERRCEEKVKRVVGGGGGGGGE